MDLFGAGTLVVKPVGGNQGANPTPSQLGILQGVEIDISATIKELYGNKQFPVDIRRAEHKLTGKAKFARIFGKQWVDFFYGTTTAASYKAGAIDEAHTAAATVTIVPPSSGTFSEDFGVVDHNGLLMQKVASGPTVGQYSVNESTGVYTFNASETGTLLISYSYSLASGGFSSTLVNNIMGWTPILEVNLNVQTADASGTVQQALIRLFNCVPTKDNFPTKFNDFVMRDWEFAAFSNSAGNLGEINLTQ